MIIFNYDCCCRSKEGNKISGGIPTEIGNVKSLIRLDISNCSLNGTIPTELGSLNNLKDLDFSSNKMNSSIPEEFYTMSLEVLQLDNNFLQGTISSSFSNMSTLQVLKLGKHIDW